MNAFMHGKWKSLGVEGGLRARFDKSPGLSE